MPLHRIHVHQPQKLSRRDMLFQGGAGFGALALVYLQQQTLADDIASKPTIRFDRGQRHLPARAKSIIFVFLEGGPSHIDLFDPKPKLRELAGQPLPPSFKPVITPMGEYDAPLLADKRQWKQHGESGMWISDWLPHIAGCADDICVIRSCWANGLNHSNGVCQMNTGSIIGGRPSLGAWVSYGLGTENENLPAFVVMEDEPGRVINGPRNWSAGFMPAAYQGTAFLPGAEPIRNLATPDGISADRQLAKLRFLDRLNRQHEANRREQSELDARIKSYELAFRMQAEAPLAVDLGEETAHTQALYGIGQPATDVFGRNCLLARRLVERGVRFVQLYHGSGSRWDAHAGIEANHTTNCKASDQPVAGLIHDLKQRGLLDDTLVVWGGEFGRTPMSEKGDGRDHNPYGFTMWMAGGGVKGGQVIGTTDEIGLYAVEDRLHVHDLHATMLHLLGLDNMRLAYPHKGQPERPTLNEGVPCKKIFS
ncbi:MAG: DUF1501 domain-containing protein [Planctomycetaceae bacterium]